MDEVHPRRSWPGEPVPDLPSDSTRALNLEALTYLQRQYASFSKLRSRFARTQPDFYEALAPLGLPDPERRCAGCGGWSNRVLRAIEIGRALGL